MHNNYHHGWPQTLIFSPFLILHPRPSFITTREAKMLHHVKLEPCLRLASKKSLFGKHLALKTFETITFGWVMNFYPCFLSIDKLKACRWRKSIPLQSFFLLLIFPNSFNLCPLLFFSFTKRISSFFEVHNPKKLGGGRHSYNRLG